ncbi:hypothetical protein J6590_090599 [Homalodisca vitripennis]|nr:hypothetical protein J6590_090599 [Homalodisca vitripennis]
MIVVPKLQGQFLMNLYKVKPFHFSGDVKTQAIPHKKKGWLTGAPILNEVTIDDSKALKSALSSCFKQSDNINDYVI